jgi:dihydrofolate reductase
VPFNADTLGGKEYRVKPKCSVFIATSLDGYIAREDGGLDWLDAANELIPPGEDCGYGEHISTVDTLVMGRGTFEKVLGFGEWSYGATPVVVMSHLDLTLPASVPETVSATRKPPRELLDGLWPLGVRHVYVDGGLTIQSFLADGLIDELTITVIPILLGSGRPLFGPLSSDINLSLVSSREYDFGFVQQKYKVQT